MARAIQTWILEREHTGPIQVDVLTVRVVPREKIAVVEEINNITEL